MNLGARIRSWFSAASQRPRLEREMEEELAFHLASRTEELIRLGAGREEAARQARIELGSTLVQKERMRTSLGLRLWDDLRADLRYAVRMLGKSPGFTAIAIVSLALGIGANTAIFSITRAALLEKLPVPHPEQLRQLHWTVQGRQQPMDSLYGSFPQKTKLGTVSSTSFSTIAYRDLCQSEAFRGLVAFSDTAFLNGRIEISYKGDSGPGGVDFVSGNFFSALGLKPQAGRLLFAADDTAPGKNDAAVLSDRFWNARFARSRSVIGRTIEVNGIPLTIVGVAPRGFDGLNAIFHPSIFLPLSTEPVLSIKDSSRYNDPESWWLSVFGPISPGTTDAQAEGALQGIFRQTVQRTLKKSGRYDLDSMRVVVTPGSHGQNPFRFHFLRIDSILSALAFLVLLLACTNLANLLLARGAARQKEVSLRIALGAGRVRILRQIFTENLLLSLAGGLAGTAIGYEGLSLAHLLDQPTPKLSLDMVAIALGLSLLTCLLFGGLPAWRAVHASAQEGMRETTQMTARRSHTRLGKSLVVAQIALSAILLAGAGLFIQTLHNLVSVQLGFQPEHLLLFNLSLTSHYKTRQVRAAAYEQIHDRLSSIPGVISSSYSTDALIAGNTSTSNFDIAGRPPGQTRAWENIVGPHFFQTMGIPVLQGRVFSSKDTASSQPVAVVNEQLARELFPKQSPIGQTFNSGSYDSAGIRIVGICGNARFRSLRDAAPPTFYLFSRQVSDYGPDSQMTYALKTEAAPVSLLASVREEVRGFDRGLAVYRVRTQEEQIHDTLHTQILFVFLTSAFGLLALVLACIGIYGIMAYTVTRRKNEIGIRIALGAQAWQVMRMVLGEALWLAAFGIAVGTLVTMLLTRSIESMLYGLMPYDPLTLGMAALLLLMIAVLAGLIPARRAASVDPIQALHHE